MLTTLKKLRFVRGVLLISAPLFYSASSLGAAPLLASEDFAAYDPALPLYSQTGGGTGFAPKWTVSSFGATWGEPLVADSVTQSGTFVTEGQSFRGGHGRLQRLLEEPVDSGTVWVSTVMERIGTSGTMQFWIGSGESVSPDPEAAPIDPQILHVDVVAGFRLLAENAPEFFDVTGTWSADEEARAAEVYVQMTDEADNPILISGPILMVAEINVDAGTVTYYMFQESDNPTLRANASFRSEPMDIHSDRLVDGKAAVSGVAVFSVNLSYALVSNIRISRDYGDVARSWNQFGHSLQARTVPSGNLSGSEWASVPSHEITRAHGAADIPGSVLQGAWQSMWDENYLYVKARMESDTEDAAADEIEFFTDGSFHRFAKPDGNTWPPTTIGPTFVQWIVGVDGAGFSTSVANNYSHGAYIDGAPAAPVATGIEILDSSTEGRVHEVLVRIPWDGLGFSGTPALGAHLGFEAQLHDRYMNGATSASRKLGWADGSNRAYGEPGALGTLVLSEAAGALMSYDFSDLESGVSIETNPGTAGDGWAGVWEIVWDAPWTPDWPARGGPFVRFAGDFDSSGLSLQGFGAGRLARQMDESYDEGQVYVSFVVGNDTSSSQFWLGDWADFSENSPNGLVAGIRSNGGEIEVIDILRNPENPETYLGTGVFPNSPVLVVVHVDYNAGSIAYSVFEGGEEIDPGNPSAYYQYSVAAADLPPINAVAYAGFSSRETISNLRVGDGFNQVIPPAEQAPNAIILGNHAHAAPVLDGVIDGVWEAAAERALAQLTGQSGTRPDDWTASFRTLWDADNLYLLIEVEVEDLEWINVIELYTDANYGRNVGVSSNNTGYDHGTDFQWVINLEEETITYAEFQHRNALDQVPEAIGDGAAVAVSSSASGYTVEVVFPWTALGFIEGDATLGLPSQGSRIGFDAEVADARSGYGKLAWSGSGNSWMSPARFGTIYLADPATVVWESSPISAQFDIEGGQGSFDADPNFSFATWEAESSVDWVTVGEPSSGEGAGMISYTVAENPGLYDRSTTISVGGAGHTVHQAGSLPVDVQAALTGMSAVDEGDFTVSHPWLGLMNIDNFPWVGTESSWEWIGGGATDAAMWLYNPAIGWWFTGSSYYPYGWSHEEGVWMYFYTDEAFEGGRWIAFFNAAGTEYEWSFLP